jgi:glycosyltransferase involved in cell wall biosynthesis
VGTNPRILVMTRYHTGRKMASPGIRAYHIARVLAENVPGARVTLATASAEEIASSGLPFGAVPYSAGALTTAVRESDIVIGSRYPLYLFPLLYTKRVVLDMFTPSITEWIELSRWIWRANVMLERLARDLFLQMALADFILCANDRQRDLYFGMMSALGRVTPEVYDDDRSLTQLFGLAPYGVRPNEPQHTRRVLKGVWPGIAETDTVLIWNGAIIEWYDVETLIRAIHRISRERNDIKLFFLGTEHPDNPSATTTLGGLGGGTQRFAYDLARELDLVDRFVFFNFGWVDYDDTANYLCEADIGVCTYFESLETHFSFRSRFLDLLWTELPILCTRGDVWAQLVERRPLGVAVPERNEDAMVEAILRLADDRAFREQCKANLRREKEAHRWERVLEGLVDYCSRPAGQAKKRSRLPLLTSALASSLAANARLAWYRRMDSVNFPWTRQRPPRTKEETRRAL